MVIGDNTTMLQRKTRQAAFARSLDARSETNQIIGATTSASGQTRRFRDVRSMSGLPLTADISGPGRHFAKVPEAEIITIGLTNS
jgi:hypothetical protein